MIGDDFGGIAVFCHAKPGSDFSEKPVSRVFEEEKGIFQDYYFIEMISWQHK